jgi:hypothetical protein
VKDLFEESEIDDAMMMCVMMHSILVAMRSVRSDRGGSFFIRTCVGTRENLIKTLGAVKTLNILLFN